LISPFSAGQQTLHLYQVAGGSGAAPVRAGDDFVFISHCGKDCKKDFADLLEGADYDQLVKCDA
jgi:hypothetical protein